MTDKTTTDLAAALIAGVPTRYQPVNGDRLLHEADVLAALTAALDGVDERAGALARSDDPKVMLYHGEYVEALRALFAQIAALRAERDTVLGMYMLSSEEGFRQKARAEAAEAEAEKLRGASKALCDAVEADDGSHHHHFMITNITKTLRAALKSEGRRIEDATTGADNE